MKLGVLISRHNDPNRRESFPMFWQRDNPVEMDLEVHSAVEESIGLIARNFPQTTHQLPLENFAKIGF